ncbi:MAG: prohibitin family protein [Chloroflexi bacterium]|nr:prohibitin family protein [Chloroflexota bacterium]MCL5075848.1 prohibitin family protein [Chloroflexota bacterium]
MPNVSMRQIGPGRMGFGWGKWVLAALFLVALWAFVTSFVVIVPAGHRGVVTWFGSVEDRVLGEGLAIVVPVAERVIIVDVRVQPHPFKEIDAASKEMQSVRLTGMMNFHIKPDKVNDLYQRVGLDFANKVIDPAFNDYMKEVMPTYSIVDILPKRDEIRRNAMDKLAENLSRYHIVIDDIYISDIQFSPEYSKAIEDKQTQQQRVETERQILAQKEIQAKQMVAQAQGEANAIHVRAQGQAAANRELAASLTPEVIQYQYVQKLSDKVQVILVPSGQQFLLDTKGLLGGSAQPKP